MISDIYKIIALLIVCAVILVMLKNYRIEYALLFSVAITVSLLIYVIKTVYPAINTVREIYETSSVDFDGFSVVLKAIGIAYLVNFCADTCRDFGQTALAEKAEFVGKCALLILSVPLINSILQIAIRFAKL